MRILQTALPTALQTALQTAALAAALLLSSTAFAATNLVINGDFETGDLTGWAHSEPALALYHGVTADNLYGGNASHVFYDGTDGHLGSLTQTVGTLKGALYTLEFDLQRYDSVGSSDNQLQISFAGHTVLDETNVSHDWKHYTFTNLKADGLTSLLSFANRNHNDWTQLDNVSVIMTAVPEPSIAFMMLGGLFLVAYRSRRPEPF